MTESNKGANNQYKELSKTQLNFLEFLKEFGWGKIEITVQNGEPVSSKELEHTHRHKEP